MAGVSIIVPGAAGDRPGHQKVTIASQYHALTFDWIDPGTDLDQLAMTWVIQDRPGRKALTRPGSQQLTTQAIKATFAGIDPQQSIEASLTELAAMAQTAAPVAIRYGSMSSGFFFTGTGYWVITSCKISVVARQQGTNNATQATADLTLTEANVPRWSAPASLASAAPANNMSGNGGFAVDGSAGIGTAVSGSLSSGSTSVTTASTYTVKAGDSLTSIAVAQLGSSDVWRLLASLNKIFDPRSIAPGQRLLLPR